MPVHMRHHLGDVFLGDLAVGRHVLPALRELFQLALRVDLAVAQIERIVEAFGLDGLFLAALRAISAHGTSRAGCWRCGDLYMRTRLEASSIRSMALSGMKRSGT